MDATMSGLAKGTRGGYERGWGAPGCFLRGNTGARNPVVFSVERRRAAKTRVGAARRSRAPPIRAFRWRRKLAFRSATPPKRAFRRRQIRRLPGVSVRRVGLRLPRRHCSRLLAQAASRPGAPILPGARKTKRLLNPRLPGRAARPVRLIDVNSDCF